MHPSGCKHGSRKPLADARICRLSIAGVGRSGSPAGDRDARTLRRFAREVRHRRPPPIGARIWFAARNAFGHFGRTCWRLHRWEARRRSEGVDCRLAWFDDLGTYDARDLRSLWNIARQGTRPRSARPRPACGADRPFKARLFHSVVLPSGVFSRARGIAISTWPKVPNSERDRWP